MHRHFWFVFLAIIVFSQTVKAQEPKEWVKENLNNLVELYVHFHKTPELSFHEKETAARLASELKSVGAEVTENVGGFGIVGLMKNGDGPTVMVRTDLDALPIIEATDVPYASKVTTVDADSNTVGVMHACGHDIHMTTLAGVAQFLAANKDKWQGTVMFIGQRFGFGATRLRDGQC